MVYDLTLRFKDRNSCGLNEDSSLLVEEREQFSDGDMKVGHFEDLLMCNVNWVLERFTLTVIQLGTVLCSLCASKISVFRILKELVN